MKEIAYWVLGAIAFFVVLPAFVYYFGFINSEVESQRTKVFKNSQAYQDGMMLQLNSACMEYNKADATGRIGIKNMVADTFASVDTTSYPNHLQVCLNNIGVR